MGALGVLLIANVPARELGRSIIFGEELTQFLTILFTFAGLSYAVRKAYHIRMAAVFDLVNEKTKKAFILTSVFISALVMFFMAYLALDFVIWQHSMGQTTPALRVPFRIVIAIAPLGFFLAGIEYVRTFIKNIVEKEVWMSYEQKSEYEEAPS